jgi:hypothetical protein
MTDLRKAAEMALAALKGALIHDPEAVQEEIAVLEQALAESANSTTDFVEPKAPSQTERKREWVGLTDADIQEMTYNLRQKNMCVVKTEDIFREAEAKLKEKNT